jgi:hypothetical protein
LSGFDRLVFRGALRQIAYPFGLNGYLWANQVLLKDFGSHAQKISETVKSAALEAISSAGRPVRYLQSSRLDKESIARSIAAQDHITDGPSSRLATILHISSADQRRQEELPLLSAFISVYRRPNTSLPNSA